MRYRDSYRNRYNMWYRPITSNWKGVLCFPNAKESQCIVSIVLIWFTLLNVAEIMRFAPLLFAFCFCIIVKQAAQNSDVFTGIKIDIKKCFRFQILHILILGYARHKLFLGHKPLKYCKTSIVRYLISLSSVR